MYGYLRITSNYLLTSWLTSSLIKLCCVRKCCAKELKEARGVFSWILHDFVY